MFASLLSNAIGKRFCPKILNLRVYLRVEKFVI